jgi:7-cyano-7-deazaguanine synthase in queuosine biosynthesis
MTTHLPMTTPDQAGRLRLDLSGVRRGERLLMGLSGGLDSAYLAWRLLRRGHPLLLLHCRYVTRQQRYPEEERAHRQVLDWLTGQGLTSWELVSSEVSIQGITGYVHSDNDALYWQYGMMLRNPDRSDISTIARTSTADDPSPRRPAAQRRERMLRAAADRDVRLAYALRAHPKAALIGDMPRELYALTWSCRRPRDGAPCHACHTCRLIDAATGYEPDAEAEDAAEEQEPEPQERTEEPGAQAPSVPRPGVRATRAQWAAYAQALGATEVELADLTKAQMIERYG